MKIAVFHATTALAAALIATPSAAWAQGASATTAAEPADNEIIVTAQKRAERLEDVPISITAASAEKLEQTGILRLEDIGRIAPGVQLSRVGIYSQPSIRGVTTALAATPENNIGTYVDGVYIRSARGINMDLTNIASVQVLKGPQGTLFGRNATGGAILIETLQPSLTETTGRVQIGYGSFDDKRAQGYFSTPLSDKAAIGIVGTARKSDGYLRDISGFDSAPLGVYGAGARLRLEPDDDFSVTAKLDWSRVSDGRALATTMYARPLAQFLFPALPVATKRFQTSINHPVINRSTQLLGSLKLEYRLGGATLTSITSYQDEHNYLHFETDGSPALIYDEYNQEEYDTFQQEVNLTSTTDGPLQYVLGLYYFNSKIDQHDRRVLSFPSTVYAPQQRTQRDTEAYAAYADLTWQATEGLFLTAGLRYSHEKPGLKLTQASGVVSIDSKATFNSATPRVVVRYELDPDSNVYASFSKGFKSGLIDQVTPFLRIKPEKIEAWEIGYKTRRGKLRFDTAAYYYDYKDLQVGSVVIIGGINQTITANAANAEIYGAEAQLSAEIYEGMNLSSGIAYTHARYKDFPNAVVSLPSGAAGLNSSTCANPSPPPATVVCTQDYSGQRIVRSPDLTINVGLDYSTPTDYGTVQLSANGTYTSAFAPQKSDRGLNGRGYRYNQPATFLLNVRAALTLPGDRMTLAVFGRNVTDDVTYLTRTGNAFGDYEVQGEPATWGVSVDYRF